MLADKEVLLTALNIKAMTFTGLDQDESETEEEDEDVIKANGTAGKCKKNNNFLFFSWSRSIVLWVSAKPICYSLRVFFFHLHTLSNST